MKFQRQIQTSKRTQKISKAVLSLLFGLIATLLILQVIPTANSEGSSEIEVKIYVNWDNNAKRGVEISEPVDGDDAIFVAFSKQQEKFNISIIVYSKDGNIIETFQNDINISANDKVRIWNFKFSKEQKLKIFINGNLYENEISIKKPESNSPITWIIPISGIIGVIFALLMARYVLSQEKGNEKMREIANAIKEGAEAFLKRQYTTIAIFAIIVAIFIGVAIGFSNADLGIRTAVGFLLGAFCSAIAGYTGMFVSIRANLRVASASQKDINRALKIAMRGGAVTGFIVVAMSLIGVYGLFIAFGVGQDPRAVPQLIVGFGFGASFVALFAQLGGGIYTKAADVGADLVGKIEAGIPEDDPRNPAVVADLVGDNVGDCAGRGADLFESTAAENIGAMILGIALYPIFGINGIMFPLVARAFGLIVTIFGILFVYMRNEEEDPMSPLNRGYSITTIGAIIGFLISAYFLLGGGMGNNAWLYFFGAGVIGIFTSYAFVWITIYYTDYHYRPVQEIAKASKTGHATNIIQGFAVGLECTALPILVIGGAILSSFYLGSLGAELIGLSALKGGLFGTAIATMGMLSTCAYILSMDTFGPITDNAGGINEMSHAPEEVRKKTDRLDAVGNTTKALTKGYAVGSAGLAAFLLFAAYMVDAHLTVIDLAKPVVFVGAMIGAMLVFLFSAFAIKAVGRAAYYVIENVRKQFKEHPEIMEGKMKPNYAECVDIVTKGALKEMVLPGVLAVLTPISVGFLLRAEAVGATLMVGTIAGILLALLMNNGGGAWDNAKKYIEMGNYGGKKSDAHKASVTGDTVGDPFKDTAGPSLHVLVKLLSTITLVFAPLFI